ncbi:MAG: hypothetical protein HY688_02855 [Chloroflexi bacterium]|nr:hypothetical protein [Chloroflexota bacterium]
MTKGRFLGLAALTAAMTGAAAVAGVSWYVRARRASRASHSAGAAQPSPAPVSQRNGR